MAIVYIDPWDGTLVGTYGVNLSHEQVEFALASLEWQGPMFQDCACVMSDAEAIDLIVPMV